MQNSIIKKGLVIGTIFLFIGIGIQPAFANKVSIIKPSENIEDCNCRVAENFNLVRLKILLNRLEVYSNLLRLLSRHNTEITIEYDKLSKDLTTFKEVYISLKDDSLLAGRPICDYLSNLFWTLADKGGEYGYLANDALYNGNLILALIYFSLFWGTVYLGIFVLYTHFIIGCGEFPQK